MRKLSLIIFAILFSGSLLAQNPQNDAKKDCKSKKEHKQKSNCCDSKKTKKCDVTDAKPGTAGKTIETKTKTK